jgi:hypothetical protein
MATPPPPTGPTQRYDKLFCRAYEANVVTGGSITNMGLLYSVYDPEFPPQWIAWYGFVQTAVATKSTKGYYSLVGKMEGKLGNPFKPFKPLRVDEFGYLPPKSPLGLLRWKRSRGQVHHVGLTVFLERPQNFEFELHSYKPPIDSPMQYQRGYISLIGVQEWNKQDLNMVRNIFLQYAGVPTSLKYLDYKTSK